MIYLSAQPAEMYFVWQLEIQLKNFNEIGLDPQNIHVIIGYKEEDGKPKMFDHLESKQFARFFYYSDTRENWGYVSSIRPHLLEKHFAAYPDLFNHTIFYHDCDIVFREKIDECKFVNDNHWYLSDTRNYLSDRYLKTFGEDFFLSFCQTVGISPMLVEANRHNTGGAQYIMKQVNAEYWKSVFFDSELIYKFLNEHNSSLMSGQKVQSWCADMWAVLWNAWKSGVSTRLDIELDFCWPKNHISRWYSTKILHNAGVYHEERSSYFCKLQYKKSSPYYIDFSHLRDDVCSSIFVQKIKEAESFQQKDAQTDLTIYLHIQYYVDSIQKIIENYLRYLYKHLDTTIYLIESGDYPRTNKSKVLDFCRYKFIGQKSVGYAITRYTRTSSFLYLATEMLVPIKNIKRSYDYILKNKDSLVRPYCKLYVLDSIARDKFINELTINGNNIDIPSDAHLTAESFMMDIKQYIKSGGENLDWKYYLNSGFNVERESRLRLLGLRIHYLNEPAYTLIENIDRDFDRMIIPAKFYNDRIKSSTKMIVRKDLSLFNYSHPEKSPKKLPDIEFPMQVYVLMQSSKREHLDSIRKEFYNKKNLFSVKMVTIKKKLNGRKRLWHAIVEVIRSHNFDSQSYLIITGADMEFTEHFNEALFKKIIQRMDEFGLEYLSTGSIGSFDKIKPLSEELVWIEKCPTSQFTFLSKQFCHKILEFKFDEKQSVESTLSEIALRKGITYPFFTRQKNHVYTTIGGSNSFCSEDIKRRYERAEDAIQYEIFKYYHLQKYNKETEI